MFCSVCRAELYDRRSELCITCGAVETLRQEFIEPWGSSRLRGIAADLTLGAARSVRSLRVFGKAPTPPPAPVSDRPALERKSGGAAQRSRSRGRSREKRKSPLPVSRLNQGGPAESSAQRGVKEERRSRSYSYYSSSSSEFQVKDLTKAGSNTAPREERGTTPKSRPVERPWRRGSTGRREQKVEEPERGD